MSDHNNKYVFLNISKSEKPIRVKICLKEFDYLNYLIQNKFYTSYNEQNEDKVDHVSFSIRDGHIVALNLKSIEFIRPILFSKFSNLEKLSISSFLIPLELNGTFYSQIFQCKNLRILELISFNTLKIIDAFQPLNNLISLNLSHNNLNSIPNSIRYLFNLKDLVLIGNSIPNSPNWVFERNRGQIEIKNTTIPENKVLNVLLN